MGGSNLSQFSLESRKKLTRLDRLLRAACLRKTLGPLALAGVIGLASSACSEDVTGDDGLGPGEDPVVALQVVPSTIRLESGDSTQLVAELVLESGATRVASDAVWMSQKPAIAQVESDGTVRALTSGRAMITASAAGKSAEALVLVPGWFSAAPLPAARRAGHAAAVAGKIYYMGGNAGLGEEYVASTFVYDPATDSWSGGADMPTAP